MTFDPVNKPSHYTEGREFETIDVIEDWGLGFHLGNAVKYISRAGRKDPDKLHQDISKAIWYLERFQDMHAMKRRAKIDLEQFADQGTYSVLSDEQDEIEFEALGEIPSSVRFGIDDDIYEEEVPFAFNFEKDLASSRAMTPSSLPSSKATTCSASRRTASSGSLAGLTARISMRRF